MGNKYLILVLLIFPLMFSSCREETDGGWPPFQWMVESISSPEDISVEVEENYYVYIKSKVDKGEVVMTVSNYTPWLGELSEEVADGYNVTRPGSHSVSCDWGTVSIDGHTVRLTLADFSEKYKEGKIKIYLSAGDAGSVLILERE